MGWSGPGLVFFRFFFASTLSKLPLFFFPLPIDPESTAGSVVAATVPGGRGGGGILLALLLVSVPIYVLKTMLVSSATKSVLSESSLRVERVGVTTVGR